ncbi:hypothetical protein DL93DRAFT_2083158 [Clavulina sp. PMI_390]|nr:hypothetical protein DL93DRAFT_2083158 [Clavulina sp. PMI_390]
MLPTSTTGASVTPSAVAAAAPAAAARTGGRRAMTLRGAFAKELHALMYACGDVPDPASDTVNVMEEILIEYMEQLAMEAIRGQPKSRLTVDGLRRALGRPADKKKLGRLNDLVYRDNVIAAARRGWKDPY